MITAQLVSELREKTGAGMMDAKQALVETQGDMDKAVEWLRAKGMAKAGKKADRETHEGLVHCYTHATGKTGVMVEVLCETDFVARTEAFQHFCHDVALHIAAVAPAYLSATDIPSSVLDSERAIYVTQAEATGKPPEMIEKIVEGKLAKFTSDACLLTQPFIKDETKTVEDILKEAISTLGENIQITRFARFSIGT